VLIEPRPEEWWRVLVVKDLDLDATIPWYINPGRAAGGMQV
jgi:hypothetical protein